MSSSREVETVQSKKSSPHRWLWAVCVADTALPTVRQMELLSTEFLAQLGHRAGLVPMCTEGQALSWEFKGHILCGMRVDRLQDEGHEERVFPGGWMLAHSTRRR